LLQQAMKKAPVMPSAAKHLLFLAENKQKAHLASLSADDTIGVFFMSLLQSPVLQQTVYQTTAPGRGSGNEQNRRRGCYALLAGLIIRCVILTEIQANTSSAGR